MSAVNHIETPMVIAYYRKSQDKQGQKWSIARQSDFVERFCEVEGLIIAKTFEETHTGKQMERPEFKKALELSRKTNMPIVIKSLSRLGRNASAVIGLISKEKIIVADKGLTCDKMVLGLLAVIDENEVRVLGQRTKEGLAAAKKRGVKLGTAAKPMTEEGYEKSMKTRVLGADEYALRFGSVIERMYNEEHLTWRDVATKLTWMEIPTRRGGDWYATTARNVVVRYQKLQHQIRIQEIFPNGIPEGFSEADIAEAVEFHKNQIPLFKR